MTLIITSLAVYRITRLVTEDSILDRPRAWVESKSEWSATLVTCAWCASFWIGLLATIALATTEAVQLPAVAWIGLPFALSAIAGLLSSWE